MMFIVRQWKLQYLPHVPTSTSISLVPTIHFQIREKHFHEMKKIYIGMTEVRNKGRGEGWKDGNRMSLSSVYPDNNPYIYAR